jgi:hypothetical protein
MKKIVMLALCMSAVTAFAQDALQFDITAVKKGSSLETRTLKVMTVPGSEGIFTNMAEEAAVNEVNTRYGQVELKPVKIQTGIVGKIQYKPTKDANVIDVAVEYEWLDKSAIISKGQHLVKAKVGETITLPGANGIEVKLAVKS